jgi:transcriptional regulator with XRE-family HTH domain
MDNEPTPSDVVAARVREVRGKRHLTVAELAERCAAIGAPDLTAQALYKLEQRRPGKLRPRPVTVDELLALGAALNVAPDHLLVPPDDYSKPYRVTSGISERAIHVRHWIRGEIPLPDADFRDYFGEVPLTEYKELVETAGTGWPLPPEEAPDGEHHQAP